MLGPVDSSAGGLAWGRSRGTRLPAARLALPQVGSPAPPPPPRPSERDHVIDVVLRRSSPVFPGSILYFRRKFTLSYSVQRSA